MRYLILSERDREKFGCPDKLPFDWTALTNREAVAIQGLGFGSLSGLQRMLAEQIEEGVNEKTVAALDALVWLALRRSGIHVDIHELEYDLAMEWYDDDPAPEPIVKDDPGKAPGPAAPRKSSPRPARASKGTSRRRSTPTP